MAENNEKLFTEFPPISTAEWKAKVEADLKGADFEKKLVWRTNEGFNVQPMYRAEDIKDLKTTDSLPGEYPFVRGTKTNNNWFIRQEIVVEDVKKANEKALDILNKGVDSLGFKLAVEPSAENVAALLEGIHLPAVEVNFACCPGKAVELAKVLVDYIKANKAEETFKGSIEFNPYKRLLKHGLTFSKDITATGVELVKAVADVKNLRVLAVDSFMLTNAGAYIYQEIGYALAWGAQWMTALTEAGLTADEVAKRIKFNMGVSTNYFM